MPEVIDIILRTIAVMSAVLLAVLLLVTGRQRAGALPGAMLCLAAAAFFATSLPGAKAAYGVWGDILTALCVTKAAWFWLFSRALFNDKARLDRRHFFIVASVAIVGTWQQNTFLAAYRSGNASVAETFAGFGFEFALLVLVLAGLYEAWRGMAIDLVERRRRLRVGFLIAAGAYLVMTLAVQSFNLIMDVSTPVLATRANMLLTASACLAGAWLLLQPRNISWLDPLPVVTTALSPAETAVLAKLQRAIERDRIYLQDGLTIGGLATHLGTGEHVLRRVINRGMGYRNFNDFLHAWRIREACEELRRPERAREPVLAIAMKVGYGSIGAFNRAFRARIGMTPTDYRRRTLQGVPDPG